jgi:hypothetical protein
MEAINSWTVRMVRVQTALTWIDRDKAESSSKVEGCKKPCESFRTFMGV